MFDSIIDRLEKRNLLRNLITIESIQSPKVIINGREFILLCSNNYLGLTEHPRLKEAGIEAIKRYGTGAGASRLISGNMELHEKLEKRISQFKRTESALIFNSGYIANIGIISSIMEEGDVIFSDELNHASIIDGCRLSKAQTAVYPHKDIYTLEKLLAKSKDYKKRLIITEAVFSMDGDIAPLPSIIKLAKNYSSMVMVDEAHATGVFGSRGSGIIEEFGMDGEIDIIMGTLGKAIGAFGAYFAGSSKVRNYLINRCRSFIYTTALPPSIMAVAIEAINIIEEEKERRRTLWDNVRYLKSGLRGMGYNIMNSESHIIPVLIGDAKSSLEISRLLFEEGVYVTPIRPPTVKEGSSRLRVIPMATHREEELKYSLKAFKRVGRWLKII
jgi:glycine C-acetyltransferase/8-amino-7-oxononanoate synthase